MSTASSRFLTAESIATEMNDELNKDVYIGSLTQSFLACAQRMISSKSREKMTSFLRQVSIMKIGYTKLTQDNVASSLQKNVDGEIIEMMTDLVTHAFQKLANIMTESANEIVNENPTYIRSSKFSTKRLLRMAEERAFCSSKFVSKLVRLFNVVVQINVRLSALLKLESSCIKLLKSLSIGALLEECRTRAREPTVLIPVPSGTVASIMNYRKETA